MVKLNGLSPACNFTEAELKTKFITDETGLEYQYVACLFWIWKLHRLIVSNSSRIEHPTISFGGSTGSACSSIAFTKAASRK